MSDIELNLDKLSYKLGDTLNISFFTKGIDIDSLEFININIFRLGKKRDELSLGFGDNVKLEHNKFKISRKLDMKMKEGIHFIEGIKLIYQKGPYKKGLDKIEHVPISKKYFQFGEPNNKITKEEIEIQVKEILSERKKYRTHQIIACEENEKNNANKHRILIFGAGNFIFTSQELKGYTIHPIKGGLKHSNMLEAVNGYMKKNMGITIPNNKETQETLKKTIPIFVIEYTNVLALNFNTAFQYCLIHSENIFSILANQKGQRPYMFSSVVIDLKTTQYEWQIYPNNHNGNIVPEFTPTATADEIETLLPILSDDPWLKFIFDNFSHVQNERNRALKYFRLWSMLEFIANEKVPEDTIGIKYANNQPILLGDGKQRKTTGALNKIYHFIYTLDLSQSTFSHPHHNIPFLFEMSQVSAVSKKTEKIILWDFLRAMYAIRNAAAHTGDFIPKDALKGKPDEKLAAKYYKYGDNSLNLVPLEFDPFLSRFEGLVKDVIDNLIDDKE